MDDKLAHDLIRKKTESYHYPLGRVEFQIKAGYWHIVSNADNDAPRVELVVDEKGRICKIGKTNYSLIPEPKAPLGCLQRLLPFQVISGHREGQVNKLHTVWVIPEDEAFRIAHGEP